MAGFTERLRDGSERTLTAQALREKDEDGEQARLNLDEPAESCECTYGSLDLEGCKPCPRRKHQ